MIFTAILAVEERLEYVFTALKPRVPGAVLFVDRQRVGVWPMTQVILRMGIESGASHILVLQDDVFPCRDLVAGVTAAAQATDHSFSLWATRRTGRWPAYERAVGAAQLFAPVDHYGGPGIVYRADQATEFLAESAAEPVGLVVDAEHPRYDASKHMEDLRWYLFLKRHKYPILVTVPSLIEHLGDYSTVTQRRFKLRAHRFIGAERSALEDWWQPFTQSVR